MRFVDEVEIEVNAGNGGNGAVAFRRERFRPKGGPSGGDGGRGGDVILRADRNLTTLLDLRYRPKIAAQRGQDGQGKDRHGRGGENLIVRVPVGTAVYDVDTGELIGDLTDDEQELTVASGGAGGRGNMRFATPQNRAPRRADPGNPGGSRTVRLELRLLADVGIIGLPNAGKSTLISKLSAARPKVADYPFTTLVPNLGVVEIGRGASFVMADIPGLVPGASKGAGLGSRFLRHVQRTAVLLYLLAPDEAGDSDPTVDFEILSAELEQFDPDLAERPKLVALNKADLKESRDAEPDLREALRRLGLDLVFISAVTGQGLDDLKRRLVEIVRKPQEED